MAVRQLRSAIGLYLVHKRHCMLKIVLSCASFSQFFFVFGANLGSTLARQTMIMLGKIEKRGREGCHNGSLPMEKLQHISDAL